MGRDVDRVSPTRDPLATAVLMLFIGLIMVVMGAGCSSPVGINAVVDGDVVHVRAVSYGYTDEPRRVEKDLPIDYVMDELLDISDYLTGRRDTI